MDTRPLIPLPQAVARSLFHPIPFDAIAGPCIRLFEIPGKRGVRYLTLERPPIVAMVDGALFSAGRAGQVGAMPLGIIPPGVEVELR